MAITKAQREQAQADVKTQRTRRTNADVLKQLREQKVEELKDAGVDINDVNMDSRRMLIGTVLGIVAGTTTFAGISTLATYAIASLVIVSASAFLSTLIYILGMVLAVYMGLKAASTVFAYVITEKDVEHWALFKGQVLRSREKITSMWRREQVTAR